MPVTGVEDKGQGGYEKPMIDETERLTNCAARHEGDKAREMLFRQTILLQGRSLQRHHTIEIEIETEIETDKQLHESARLLPAACRTW